MLIPTTASESSGAKQTKRLKADVAAGVQHEMMTAASVVNQSAFLHAEKRPLRVATLTRQFRV
jgi:hypothetical protein